MTVHAMYLADSGEFRPDLSIEDLDSVRALAGGLLWVDILGTADEDARILSEVFEFHPLTIRDAMEPGTHSARLEDYGDYVFLVSHGINYALESDLVEIAELSVYIGPNYVVSAHEFPLLSMEAVLEGARSERRAIQAGSGRLAHTILEAFWMNIRPTVERMAEIIDDLEELAIHAPSTGTLESILRLKRSTQRINRSMPRHVDALMDLGGRTDGPLAPASRHFRDLASRVIRIADSNTSLRERADNALAVYMGAVSVRQNETMKTLAVVAAIFLPLSLVAGIYGMNFENIPELRVRWAYFAVLSGMGLVGAATAWGVWLRHRTPVRRLQRVATLSLRAPVEHLRFRPRRGA